MTPARRGGLSPLDSVQHGLTGLFPHRWTEKVKKMEVELRNKEENKEVSLGTSKANYMDPRITVAWCKRCDLEISRLFPKTLKDKFNWAMGVEGDWRFEAAELKSK